MRNLVSNTLKLAAGAGLAIGMLATATGGAQAMTPNVKAAVDHYIECLEWLIKDPAKHAELCTPSRVTEVLGQDQGHYVARKHCNYES